MSVENSPNINAVGLVVDIVKSIRENCRGKAKEMEIWKDESVLEKVGEIVEELRYAIDYYTDGEK